LLLLLCFYFLYICLDLGSFHINFFCFYIFCSLLGWLLSRAGFCFLGIYSSRLFRHIYIVLDRMILYQFSLLVLCMVGLALSLFLLILLLLLGFYTLHPLLFFLVDIFLVFL